MTARAVRGWAPWALFGTFGGLVAVTATFAMRGTVIETPLSLIAFMVILAFVGALLAARRPSNGIGWVCLAGALLGGSQFAGRAYATHGLIADPGSLPGAQFAAWSGSVSTSGFYVITMLLPLLFPTGGPPSPRWRPILWLVLMTTALGTFVAAFSPGPLQFAPEFINPVGLDGVGGLMAVIRPLYLGLFLMSLLLSTASLVARYRQARGPERLQLKWFLYAFLLVIGAFFLGIGVGPLLYGDPAAAERAPLYVVWWSIVWPTTFMTVPIAIGIAVLRHRLYDIDVLINRTLVYGAVTATLAATYFAVVVVLGAALRPLTDGSEVAVALSTLLVLALFAPLRRRIQAGVDRRFFRSRYDAARTLDAFGARLRDEVDLDDVRADLVGVVGDTLRPTHVSVWLREARR
jgi:hypothetical protein